MGLELINELKKQKKMTSEELARQPGVPLGTLNTGRQKTRKSRP